MELNIAFPPYYSAGMYLSTMDCTVPSEISSARAPLMASSRAVLPLSLIHIYNDGVLTLTLPKRPELVPENRQIAIQ